MKLKKAFQNKYNFYLILCSLLISILGSIYFYKDKEIHSYIYTYKVRLPFITKLNKDSGIGTLQIPVMSFYEFHSYIGSNNDILKNCKNFHRDVRLSIWEARNEIDWRFQIKNPNPKNIERCINQIVESIEEYREAEILKVSVLNEFESKIFEDSVKEVINNNNFKKFRDFVKQETKGLEDTGGNDNEDKSIDRIIELNEMGEILAGVLKLGTLNISEKLSTPKFSDNFLTGYIYNFLESYKSSKYISSLTKTKVEKVSEEYFLRKNIFKFNLSILFLLIILLTLINIKELKKLL